MQMKQQSFISEGPDDRYFQVNEIGHRKNDFDNKNYGCSRN